MHVQVAENFNDYVALMAANSPHALVMDWWRRLDLALHEYAVHMQVVRLRDRRAIEETVSLGPSLGPRLADCVRELRLLRNQVAHESIYNLSPEKAAAYAREAFSVIAALGKRL